MNADVFDRLDAELARKVRDGAHLPPATRRERRVRLLVRRAAMLAALALVLAASLVSEFPASAGGRPVASVTAMVLGP